MFGYSDFLRIKQNQWMELGAVREIREANPRAHAKRAPAPYKGFAFARRQSRRPLACLFSI